MIDYVFAGSTNEYQNWVQHNPASTEKRVSKPEHLLGIQLDGVERRVVLLPGWKLQTDLRFITNPKDFQEFLLSRVKPGSIPEQAILVVQQ